MSVGTDASDKQVDASGFGNHLLIVAALSLQVFGVTIQDVDILLRAVDVVEQVCGHERVVALGMILGQVHIFVHVECQHVLERHTALFVGLHQFAVHADGRRAGRQTQYKLVVGCGVEFVDAFDDMFGSPTRKLLIAWFNNQSHNTIFC